MEVNDNPSIDAGGISQEVFNEDPDFAESYFRGDYDVTCAECKGNKVVSVVQLNDAEKWLFDAIHDFEEAAEYDLAERAAEMRMGC